MHKLRSHKQSIIILAGRVLVIPLVGASVLIGVVLARVACAPPRTRVGRATGLLGIAVLFALHLGLSPLARVGLMSHFEGASRQERELPVRSRLNCRADSRVLLVNGHSAGVAMYSAAAFFSAGHREHAGWHVLTMAPNEVELIREGPKRFTLTTVGARSTSIFEQLYRPSAAPLAPGTRVRVDGMRVTVLESTALGPMRVAFELDHEIDAPQYCFVRWFGAEQRLQSFEFPHEPLRITAQRGPFDI